MVYQLQYDTSPRSMHSCHLKKLATVRRLKNLHQFSLVQSKKSGIDLEEPLHKVQELSRKKTGQPLLIREELDAEVQDYVRHVRKGGLAINTSVVIAAGCGMIMNRDANQLSDIGGGITLTNEWAKNLLKRGFVKRKACSKAKVNPEQFDKLKEEFLLEIKNIVSMDEIPHELILNFDWTGLNYVPVTPWTMEEEGMKRVEVIAKDDERQITAVFCGSLTGVFTPSIDI